MNTTKKGNQLRKHKKLGIVSSVLLAGLGVVGCTYSKTDASSFDCVYNGGPLDNANYRGYAAPGTGRENQGAFSEIVSVPVRNIQYRFSADPAQGDTTKTVNVKVKGVDQTYEPTLNFTLRTEIIEADGKPDKPVACDLVEKHLRPLGATDFNDPVTESKWVQDFLNERVQQVVLDVTAAVLQEGDPTDLAQNNNGARETAAAEIARRLKPALTAALGGQWFCDPAYQFGGNEEACGLMSVTLPAPTMSTEDAALIAQAQRAKTEADNAIRAATEDARRTKEIANQREQQAADASRLADAEETIANEQGRVEGAKSKSKYSDCAVLDELGQDCALMKAAENGDFPDIFAPGGQTPTLAVVPPVESAAVTTIAP